MENSTPFDPRPYVRSFQDCLFWPAVEAITQELTTTQKKAVWNACSPQLKARINDLKANWFESLAQ